MDDARKAAAELLARLADEHDADVGPHDCPISTALRAGSRTLAAGAGPAQVASEAYRTHYDTIFGGRLAVPRA